MLQECLQSHRSYIILHLGNGRILEYVSTKVDHHGEPFVCYGKIYRMLDHSLNFVMGLPLKQWIIHRTLQVYLMNGGPFSKRHGNVYKTLNVTGTKE